MSPSRTMLPSIPSGFAPWPHRNAYVPEATALVFLFLFVSCVFVTGVSAMALFRGGYSVEQMERDRARRESGEPSLRVVERVSPVEKVEGAYSFPDSIKRDVRFRTGQNGELILRIYDDQWRDAKVTDLAPVEVDVLARRDRARSRANSYGSNISARTAQSQDDRKAVPKFIGPHERPRDRSVTAIVSANFFVTDGVQYSTDSPLFDHADPMGALCNRMARVNQLMKTGAA